MVLKKTNTHKLPKLKNWIRAYQLMSKNPRKKNPIIWGDPDIKTVAWFESPSGPHRKSASILQYSPATFRWISNLIYILQDLSYLRSKDRWLYNNPKVTLINNDHSWATQNEKTLAMVPSITNKSVKTKKKKRWLSDLWDEKMEPPLPDWNHKTFFLNSLVAEMLWYHDNVSWIQRKPKITRLLEKNWLSIPLGGLLII